MDSTRWSCTLVLISVSVTLTLAEMDTTRYVASVINHVDATVPGVSSCVFYGRFASPTLQDILRAPALESVSKLVITSRFRKEDIARLPSYNLLIVIEGVNLLADFVKLHAILEAFDPASKVLVLTDCTSQDFQVCEIVLRRRSFCSVVYLDEQHRLMYAVDVVKRVRLEFQAHPRELFSGAMMRSMQGRPLTFASRKWVRPITPVRRWLKETATFMNTTLRRSVHNCSSGVMVLSDSCYLEHTHRSKVDVDLANYHLASISSATFRYLFTGWTNDVVVLVPRSQLTIMQLFTFPFNWEVWLLVALILSASEVLKQLFPTHFRNDPILLVVCGFERHDLNTAGRWEKAILLSVMQFIFFTTCAYETKLLAIMVSKPATQEIRTIQELIASGIKVKVNFLAHTDARADSVLGEIMVNSTESIFNMDLVHSHIVERDVATLVLPFYYDPNQRLYRYSILDQSLGTVPKVYVLSVRNPFKAVLEFTNSALLESGILRQYWPMQLKFKHGGLGLISRFLEEPDDSLLFKDMTPAWIALGIGLTISVTVFVGEICFKRFSRRHLPKTIYVSEK